jgi:hypothetical protein
VIGELLGSELMKDDTLALRKAVTDLVRKGILTPDTPLRMILKNSIGEKMQVDLTAEMINESEYKAVN